VCVVCHDEEGTEAVALLALDLCCTWALLLEASKDMRGRAEVDSRANRLGSLLALVGEGGPGREPVPAPGMGTTRHRESMWLHTQ
jgi:hypothetical protein